jgi:hypothetical protein
MNDGRGIIVDLLKALLINNSQTKKNKRLQKKWLTHYQDALELEEDLEFQKNALEEAIDALSYKDRYPNEATNREG